LGRYHFPARGAPAARFTLMHSCGMKYTTAHFHPAKPCSPQRATTALLRAGTKATRTARQPATSADVAGCRHARNAKETPTPPVKCETKACMLGMQADRRTKKSRGTGQVCHGILHCCRQCPPSKRALRVCATGVPRGHCPLAPRSRGFIPLRIPCGGLCPHPAWLCPAPAKEP